ncbi:MAG TPA: type II CAAX endopeptidase family protein [Patescibacteria group bacterium]|nr:type II CAAX endopeptidase family protein [Patescibacteria group bacterium]
MSAKITKLEVVKNVAIYSAYLLIFWAFYRFLFQLPDNVEELFVKPIIWLIPLFYFLKKENFGISSLGFTFKKFVPAVILSLGLGAIFVLEGLATNFLKYGHFNFGANLGGMPLLATIGLSFATALTEETAFRGYIFSRLAFALKNELTANFVQTTLWVAIHIPIAFFILNLSLPSALVYLFITAIFGFGSAFIFANTNNIWGSVLLHILWEWPIILFR